MLFLSWITDLFVGTGVAHTIFMLALVIFGGLLLSRVRIGNVSLGVTWILFVGILAGQLGCTLDPTTAAFVKEFGLILFVFSLGMELGPGFFSSFRKGGVTLNLLAVIMVMLACLTTLIIHWATGESLLTLIGVMSGAVTNTPGMGAAQQTLLDTAGTQDPTIAQGYAVTYPLGVIGVILCLMLLRAIFRIDFKKEDDTLQRANHDIAETLEAATLEVANEAVCGKTLNEIQRHFGRQCVITRILHRASGDVELAGADTTLGLGDKLFLVATPDELAAMELLIGHRIETMDRGAWDAMKTNHLVTQKVLITNPTINGKRLGDMKLRQTFDVTITRIRRAGVELIATPGLLLQVGDTVTVVGDKERVGKLLPILGNSIKQLNEPNLIPYFLGIVLGVALGMLPIAVPGMPVPVKLGLAGGPLIVALLISTFGPKLKMVTYMSTSANHMVRMIGLSLFLASVGITAGGGFVQTVAGGGYWWVLYGFLITVIPCFLTGLLARHAFRLSYYSISGMITGAMTDPPAMAYAQTVCHDNNQVPVAYSTVYPLTMFLRVVVAEVMVLLCL
jgi:putative transport protein